MMNSTGTGWIIAVMALWILLLGGATWATIYVVFRPRHRPAQLPSPLDLLEGRFAAGEITREDFDEARARLREHELDR